MRICNNSDGMMDCCGKCYDDGICTNRFKCSESLVVNEKIVKELMKESGRHEKITFSQWGIKS